MSTPLHSAQRLALLAGLAGLSLASFAEPLYVPSELVVKLLPGRQTVDVAAAVVEGLGRVVRDEGEGTYRVYLNEGVHPRDAVVRLRQRASVAAAESVAPTAPPQLGNVTSVRKVKAILEQYEEAYEAYLDANGLKHEGEIPGLDFWESYLWNLEQRAYPFDEPLWTGYPTLIANRLRESSAPTRAVWPPTEVISVLSRGTPSPYLRWTFLGPTNLAQPYITYYGIGPINGRVNGIAVDPTNANTIYIAAAQGGVWKTTNGGTNWSPMSDNWPFLHCSCVVIDPTNPQTIYAGTGDFPGSRSYGFGIMKSTNGGLTWTNYGASVLGSSAVSSIWVNPENPSVLVATTGRGAPGSSANAGRVYRSTDGGVTWAVSVNVGANWTSLQGGTVSGGFRNLYAVANGTPGLIYRSQNGGATWTQLTNPGVANNGTLDIAGSQLQRDTAYLLLGGDRKIFKTTNAGATWVDTTGVFPNGTASLGTNYNWSQVTYDWHIHTSINGAQDAVYVGLIDIVASFNGGSTWRSMGGSNWTPTYSGTAITHNDQHSFAMNPSNPNQVLIGNDGGIHRATYNPTTDTVTWDTSPSRNLGITQFYTMAVHPTNANFVKGGTQDNATPHSLGNLATWANPGAGDGAGCYILSTNTNIQINSSQFQNLYRTNNNYASSFTITPNWSGHSRPFIGLVVGDPNNPDRVYVNTNYLNLYTISTGTWNLRLGTQLLSSSTVRAIAVAVGDSNRIYTGSFDNQVWMTQNALASPPTFTRIDRAGQANGMPLRSVTSISINPTNKNDVLVSVSGFGEGHVWRCLNPTGATPTWQNVSGSGSTGLPDIPVNDVERDPLTPDRVWYAATDAGVYLTRDAGATWMDISWRYGLPNVQVNEIIINPTTRFVYAATYGRGIWRLPLMQQVTGTNPRVVP